MNLAIIPARGGSKRIPNKNHRMVAGRPMLAWTLDAVVASAVFDVVHVSTDDPGVAALVTELGHPVEFLRDPTLADDQTGLLPVLEWVLDRYAEAGTEVDVVGLVYATAALLHGDDLRAGLRRFDTVGRSAPVMAVTRYPAPIEWSFTMDASSRLRADRPETHSVRSQDLPVRVFDAGVFLFATPRQIRDRVAAGFGHVLPSSRAIDVDDEEDLELLELVLRGRVHFRAQGATA